MGQLKYHLSNCLKKVLSKYLKLLGEGEASMFLQKEYQELDFQLMNSVSIENHNFDMSLIKNSALSIEPTYT
jgi:hypothetical protein